VTETFVLEREMGCTREEFMRWLPGAARHARAVIQGDGLSLAVAGGRVEIGLEERPDRRIALVVLPVLAVRFRFLGLGGAARAEFLERFDAFTRRGGG
jgi:hypothetical protein